MTLARYQQVSLHQTPYYHCISRCVRRAYLFGNDPVSGQNFDHRKIWLVGRIKQLSEQFAIDVCAYAVMSNHYHLVLFVNSDQAKSWTDEQVVERWTTLFPRNADLLATLSNNSASRTAKAKYDEQIALWRHRLSDISWFMRCLNEPIARRANKEDECTGRFWEGRFKSQALLDERALVSCMAYVDLNPVRAGIAKSLEGSDFTSIQERLLLQARRLRKRSTRQEKLLKRRPAQHLMDQKPPVRRSKLLPMAAPAAKTGDQREVALPIGLRAYTELLESTRKALSRESGQPERKRPISFQFQSTLHELGVDMNNWLETVQNFEKHFATAAGSAPALRRFHASRLAIGVNYKHPDKWIRGITASQQLYAS